MSEESANQPDHERDEGGGRSDSGEREEGGGRSDSGERDEGGGRSDSGEREEAGVRSDRGEREGSGGLIEQRSPEDAEREVAVNRMDERSRQRPPGGAEGGDESPSADKPMGLPAHDQAPLGSTDQHSDPSRLPPHRDRANRRRLGVSAPPPRPQDRDAG